MEMKIGKKHYFVGLLLLIVSAAAFLFFVPRLNLGAASENYQLKIEEETDELLPVSLVIQNPKDETFTISYEGINGIDEETVPEAIVSKYDEEDVTVSVNEEKKSVEVTTKKSDQALEFSFEFKKTLDEQGTGNITLTKEGKEISAVSFDIVDISQEHQKEVQKDLDLQEEEAQKTEQAVQEDQAELLKEDPTAALELSAEETTEALAEAVETASVSQIQASEFAARDLGIAPMAADMYVSNWSQFREAIADSGVEKIVLTASFAAESGAANYLSSVPISRDLVIDGQGQYSINFGSNNANWSITVDSSVTAARTLTLQNLGYTGTSATVAAVMPSSTTSSANNHNWTINLDNITTGVLNTVAAKSLVNIPNSTVNITGVNNWSVNRSGTAATSHQISAAKINVYGQLTFNNANTAANHLFYSSAANGSVNIAANAIVKDTGLNRGYVYSGVGVSAFTMGENAELSMADGAGLVTSTGSLAITAAKTKITTANVRTAVFSVSGTSSFIDADLSDAVITDGPVSGYYLYSTGTGTASSNKVNLSGATVRGTSYTNFIYAAAGLEADLSRSDVEIGTVTTRFVWSNTANSSVNFANAKLNFTGALGTLAGSAGAATGQTMAIDLENATIDVAGNWTTGFTTTKLTDVKLGNTTITGTNLTGYLFSATNATYSSLKFTSASENNSFVFAKAVGIISGTGLVSGEINGLTLTIDEHTATALTSPVIILARTQSELKFANAKVAVTAANTSRFISATATYTTVTFENSEITHVNTNSGSVVGTFYFSGANYSTLNFTNTKLTASSFGSEVESGSDDDSEEGVETTLAGGGNVIRSGGSNFTLNVTGAASEVNLRGGSIQTADSGGIVSIEGDNSDFRVSDSAILNIESLRENRATPAIMIQSSGGGFYVSDHSEINLKSNGNSNDRGATLRFRNDGNMTFDVSDSSKITINKSGSLNNVTVTAAALRMFGSNNKVLVSGNSDFVVTNHGSSNTVPSSGSGQNGNQAVQYISASSGSVFDVKSTTTVTADDGSTKEVFEGGANVSLEAKYGPAIYSDGPVAISAEKDTYFVARGNTPTANDAIFRGTVLKFTLDAPTYYDFSNTRTGGGRVLTGNASSSFVSTNSDVSFWKIGTAITGNPDASYVLSDYSTSGVNLGTTSASSNAEVYSFLTNNGSMSNMTRINGNNQRAVVDELRTATDADAYIWGHVGVPEGKYEDNRDAFTDEAFVTVGVYDENGQEVFTNTGTVVQDGSTSAVAIYGEAARGGMFKVAIPDTVTNKYRDNFMQAGWTVKVLEAWRGNSDKTASNVHLSNADDITTADRTTVDVTPPATPVITSAADNATKLITGTASEEGAKVFVKVNGQWATNSDGTLVSGTVSGGQWSLTLAAAPAANETVEVYLKDQTTGLDTAVNGEFALPDTYTTDPDNLAGNLNVATSIYGSGGGEYHDAVDANGEDLRLYPAAIQTADDVMPSISLAKTAASSGGATTSVGDTLTYTLTVANSRDDGTASTLKDVVLTDPLPADVTFVDNSVSLNGNSLTGSQYDYNVASRTLTVDLGALVGDFDSEEAAVITFEVTVDSEAFGTTIRNTAQAEGQTVAGDTLTAEAFVDNPGGAVQGTVALVSAPSTIDFGSIAFTGLDIRVDNPTVTGDDLEVKDTRGASAQKTWEVKAKVSQPMTRSGSSDVLTNALHYQSGTSDIELSESSSQTVFRKEDGGSQNISSGWSSGGDGVKLVVVGKEAEKTGTYTGVITWTLESAPAP